MTTKSYLKFYSLFIFALLLLSIQSFTSKGQASIYKEKTDATIALHTCDDNCNNLELRDKLRSQRRNDRHQRLVEREFRFLRIFRIFQSKSKNDDQLKLHPIHTSY